MTHDETPPITNYIGERFSRTRVWHPECQRCGETFYHIQNENREMPTRTACHTCYAKLDTMVIEQRLRMTSTTEVWKTWCPSDVNNRIKSFLAESPEKDLIRQLRRKIGLYLMLQQDPTFGFLTKFYDRSDRRHPNYRRDLLDKLLTFVMPCERSEPRHRSHYRACRESHDITWKITFNGFANRESIYNHQLFGASLGVSTPESGESKALKQIFPFYTARR